MAMSRRAGGCRVTSSPPMETRPPERGAYPVIARSSVVLPDPERPTSTASSPLSTVKLTSMMTSCSP